MRRKWWILLVVPLLVLGGVTGLVIVRGFDWPGSPWSEGKSLETLNGIAVYDNGPMASMSHGRSYAPDGYYFGPKWHSVEFVKRYLYQARSQRLPDGMGSAASFFDTDTPQGALNERRGLMQFRQGGMDPPIAGDVVVFGGDDDGHLAIVASVGDDFVEVVQQNAAPPRERLPLARGGGAYRIRGGRPALGWLRVPTMQANVESGRPGA